MTFFYVLKKCKRKKDNINRKDNSNDKRNFEF